MSISRSEAEAALLEVDRTTAQAETRRGYRIGGPILILWGVIWIIGYSAAGVLPVQQWGPVFLMLDAIGVALTVVLARRGRGAGGSSAGMWRSLTAAAAGAAFVAATVALFGPSGLEAYMAYPGLVCGFVYVVTGLWRMPRLAWVGAAMFVATLVGFYALEPSWLAFWMAGVGGGGLVLGGFWLRRG